MLNYKWKKCSCVCPYADCLELDLKNTNMKLEQWGNQSPKYCGAIVRKTISSRIGMVSNSLQSKLDNIDVWQGSKYTFVIFNKVNNVIITSNMFQLQIK